MTDAAAPNPIRRLLGTSAVYSLGSILGRVGAFLLLPLYTHALSLAEYGTLELVYAASSVASALIGSGLAHTALRFYFDEAPETRGRIITTAYVLSFVASAAVCCLAALFADSIGLVLLGDGDRGTVIVLMLAVMVFELSTEICFAYCRVREWALLYVSMGLFKLLAQVGASIYLVAYLHRGVEGVLGSNLISVFLVWLFLSIVVLRHCGLKLAVARIGDMYRYSLPLAMRALVGIAAANVDRLFLRTFVSVEAVAIYGLGQKFAQILKFAVIEPFQLGYGPFRFSVLKRDDAKEVQRRVTVIFALGGTLAALGLAAFTPMVIQLMSPQEYWSAAQVTSIAVIATVGAGLAYCFETGLLIHKSTATLLTLALANLAVSVVLQLCLVPTLGVLGATIAAALLGIFYASMVYVFANRRYPLQYLQGIDITMLGAGCVALAVLALFARWSWTHQLPAALGVIAVFIALVLATHGESRRMLTAALARVRRVPRSAT
jgi:O-antigen/teichoic acid export membrane protein